MNSLQKFVPPSQKTCLVHTHKSLDFRVCAPTTKETAQETMTSLHKFSPPDQKPVFCILGFICAREDVCWNHDKSTPYRFETNGVTELAVRRVKELTFALLRQSGLSASDGEKRWRASVICETYKTNWLTDSHRMKEDLEFHVQVQ